LRERGAIFIKFRAMNHFFVQQTLKNYETNTLTFGSDIALGTNIAPNRWLNSNEKNTFLYNN